MEKIEKKIKEILKKKGGLTITELVEVSNLSRSAIRIALAKLHGAREVSVRKVGMAKLYKTK